VPKLRSLAVGVALTVAASLPLAPAAHASHSCALDDNPTLDQVCESHGGDLQIIQKLICIILKSC
jgi:hypothetical protein